MEGKPNDALIKYSLRPENYLMLQTIEFLSGEYLIVPTLDLKFGESTSIGTGTIISTLFAIDFYLNYVRALTTNSIFDLVKFSTVASTQINGLTWVSSLYDIKSNSPSGGIKVISLSVSNLLSLTH
jgi:hypothetical protein